jgi:hypothetical protein
MLPRITVDMFLHLEGNFYRLIQKSSAKYISCSQLRQGTIADPGHVRSGTRGKDQPGEGADTGPITVSRD